VLAFIGVAGLHFQGIGNGAPVAAIGVATFLWGMLIYEYCRKPVREAKVN